MSLTTSMTTFDVSVELNRSVEKQLAASMTAFTTRTVEFLASEYGFDAQEAIQRLGLDSVSVSRPMKKKAELLRLPRSRRRSALCRPSLCRSAVSRRKTGAVGFA